MSVSTALALPTALAMRHPDGREVDLHPVTPTSDGGGDQQLFPPEPAFHDDAPTTGVLDGVQVVCVDAATPSSGPCSPTGRLLTPRRVRPPR